MNDHDEFLEAVAQGDESRIRALIQSDAAIAATRNDAGVSALMLALYSRKREIAELIAGALPEFDLFEASALGRFAVVDDVLRADAGAAGARSADAGTALHFACFFGHFSTAAALIARGADLNAVAESFGKVTPLHSAAAARSVELVALLLAAGADPNVGQNGGYTPLHSAAMHGQEAMVRILLAFDADSSLTSDDGKTAADMAKEQGHTTIEALLACA